jgi:hypothetical protein
MRICSLCSLKRYQYVHTWRVCFCLDLQDTKGRGGISNMCHQCQRNDKGRVVRCQGCINYTRRYCIPCITRWLVPFKSIHGGYLVLLKLPAFLRRVIALVFVQPLKYSIYRSVTMLAQSVTLQYNDVFVHKMACLVCCMNWTGIHI